MELHEIKTLIFSLDLQDQGFKQLSQLDLPVNTRTALLFWCDQMWDEDEIVFSYWYEKGGLEYWACSTDDPKYDPLDLEGTEILLDDRQIELGHVLDEMQPLGSLGPGTRIVFSMNRRAETYQINDAQGTTLLTARV